MWWRLRGGANASGREEAGVLKAPYIGIGVLTWKAKKGFKIAQKLLK